MVKLLRIAVISGIFCANACAFEINMQSNPATQMMQMMANMFQQMAGGHASNKAYPNTPQYPYIKSMPSSPFGMNPMAMNPMGANPMSNPMAMMNPMGGNPMSNPMSMMNPMGSNPMSNPMAMVNPMGMTNPMSMMHPTGVNPMRNPMSMMHPTGVNPLPTNPLNMMQPQTATIPPPAYPQFGQNVNITGYPAHGYNPAAQNYLQPQTFNSTVKPYYDKDGYRAESPQTYQQYVDRRSPFSTHNPYAQQTSTTLRQLVNPQYANSSFNQPLQPDLNGAWKSHGGEIIIIQGNQYQIQSNNTLANSGTLLVQNNIITTYSPATNVTKQYQFVKNGDLLLIKDAQGNTLLFQRLRYQAYRTPAQQHVTQPRLNHLLQSPVNR